VKEKTQNTVWW